MKETKNKILTTFILSISLITIFISFIIIYSKITLVKEYSITDKNINIPIFVYHNIVDDTSQVEYDYMQTTKKDFKKQLDGLMQFGYSFITYDELTKFSNNEIKLKKKSCILTFDDGLEGVYNYVYPLAKEYNIPFTIFIVVDRIGQEGCITWEQAKEMQDSGLVTIASHSMSHSDFSNLTVEEAVKDVNESYRIIENKLGKQSIKIFTYPYGIYCEEQIKALEEQGYIQNLTDNKINKSKNLNLSKLHRCYPLNDSKYKILLKILYRSLKYND